MKETPWHGNSNATQDVFQTVGEKQNGCFPRVSHIFPEVSHIFPACSPRIRAASQVERWAVQSLHRHEWENPDNLRIHIMIRFVGWQTS